jgi:hypothetical protein
MIKSLSQYDISSTPFSVSKTWRSPGSSENFLLSDSNYTTSSIGNNTPVGINYTDFREGISPANFISGSFNYYNKSFTESSRSLGYYSSPADVYTFTNVSDTVVVDFNLLLEESEDKFIDISEGIRVNKYVRFIPESESINVNRKYKRLVYDQIKNSYYSDTKDPTKLFGLENIDIFLDNNNRFIGDRIKVATIPQAYFGDTIKKNSLKINDDSNENSVSFVDDGYGNLITSGSVFETVVQDTLHSSSLHPNVGYSVSISEYYSVVGCPSFNSNIVKTGSVDVYKKERLISDKFVYNRTLTLKTSSLSHMGNVTAISQSDFGRSVALYEDLLATGVTVTKGGIGSSTPFTSSGFVLIYNLENTASNLPTQIITHPLSSSEQSHSFGCAVSINNDFLAVGSPMSLTNGMRGSVYLYKSSSAGYVYNTTLTGSESSDIFFGSVLEIDKSFNKLIVGNASFNNTASKAYLFESSSLGWHETKKFSPTKEAEDLFFSPIKPYFNQNNTMDGFGNSVSIYCSSSNDVKVVIGAPYDRNILEYSGSRYMRNGAAYVFEKKNCIINGYTGSHWKETRLFGDYDNFHSNRFGHSVGIYEDKMVISSPKYISEYTSSHIKNTLNNSPIDGEFFDYDFNGLLYVYTSSASGSWDVLAKYKPKKRTGKSYRFFGKEVDIFDNNIITGDPLPLLDPSLDVINFSLANTNVSSSFNGGFHIFNFDDLLQSHHVGNVFYKTGKIIVTSDSDVFSHVFENGFNDIPIYDISYKSSEQFFEKEVLCTVNPGEFNFSTNPTSYEKSSSIADIDLDGRFGFNDCDYILRAIYKKNNGNEAWWNLFNFSNPNTVEEDVDSSLFKYHVSNSFENITQARLIENKLSTPIYEYVVGNHLEDFDINADGKTDELDIKIIWKYFLGKLTSDNLVGLIRSKSVSSDVRHTFAGVEDYLESITRKKSPKYIKSEFLADASIDSFTTGSNLSPYITTIGLYNGLDLVAVAKLGTPIKNAGYFPLNFVVRFDI